MTPFNQAKAAVGPPVFLQTVGDLSAPDAMIARWRHNGAEVDIDPSGNVTLDMTRPYR